MKTSVRRLKQIIAERLLKEATCPTCGSEGAYVGFSSIECKNKDCDHYAGASGKEQDDTPDWMYSEYPEAAAAWKAFSKKEGVTAKSWGDDYGIPVAQTDAGEYFFNDYNHADGWQKNTRNQLDDLTFNIMNNIDDDIEPEYEYDYDSEEDDGGPLGWKKTSPSNPVGSRGV